MSEQPVSVNDLTSAYKDVFIQKTCHNQEVSLEMWTDKDIRTAYIRIAQIY